LRCIKLWRRHDSGGKPQEELGYDEHDALVLASRLDMGKQMESVFTPQQKKQLHQSGPWWMREHVE